MGVRLVELRRFSNLGPLSMFREQPDVCNALRILTRYQHLYNEALHIRLAEQQGISTIRIRLDLPIQQRRESTELTVGVLHRLMRAFLGATWQPVAVGFTHSPPGHRQLDLLRQLGQPAGIGSISEANGRYGLTPEQSNIK